MATPLILLGSSRGDGETKRAVSIALEDRADCLDLQNYDIGLYDYENANRRDDFLKVIDLVWQRETIVFATPVYWFAMSARLKIFFDRLTDLITIEKKRGRALAGKTAWLIATGAEENLPDGFEVPFARTCEYFSVIYRGSAYLYTGSDPDLRDQSEACMKDFGLVVSEATKQDR
jgi:multimeric flavodoxin WrbA